MNTQKNRYFIPGMGGQHKLTEPERIEAFWSKVTKKGEGECWPWNAGKDNDGYAVFWDGSRGMHAGRFLMSLKMGRPLQNHEHALHTCDNTTCVNPNHLFIGTNDDNIKDKTKKGRQRGGAGKAAVKGENHHKAKLKNSDIPIIRKRIKDGETLTGISKDYGVSMQIISMIKRGIIWKSIQ